MMRNALFLLVVVWCASLGSFVRAQNEPDGLTTTDWSSIREAYEAGRHAARPIEDGYRAYNPGQRWETRFDGRGFTIEPDAGGWSWGLEIGTYGFAGSERPVVGEACLRADGQRVEYTWDETLDEWYINDTRGLEHGYTLRQRPSHHEQGGERNLLTFTLEVRGELSPEVTRDGRSVRFVSGDGASVVTYGGLTVFDADGQELDARFEDVAEGLLLTIEEGGACYPLTIDPVAQQAYLKASNTAAGQAFGDELALSGDTAVIVAPFAFSPAAYVFVRSGTTWTQQATLQPSNPNFTDEFGSSVSISGDTAVVGARGEASSAVGVNGNEADDSSPSAGAAYVFVRSGTNWSQQAYLKASNTDAGDEFGGAVAISGDTVVVGAEMEASGATGVNGNQNDDNSMAAGAAYIFVRTGTSWAQQAYVKASNTDIGDEFGESVAISGDTIVIGTEEEASSAKGVNGDESNDSSPAAGAAYVFVRTGTNWAQQAYLKASNTDSGDEFAGSVSISGDTVVAGAEKESSSSTIVNGNQLDNGSSAAGAAYVFVRSGTTWTQEAYLKASNADAEDRFGGRVSVSDDTVVIGARAESSGATGVNGDQLDNGSSAAGAAYVFVRSGTAWTQQAYLKASNTDADDEFGSSVSVSNATVLVGADAEASSATGVNGDESDNSADLAGAAYVYDIQSVPATEVVRAGAPPNPSALLPGQTSGPIIGATWDPVIDHTSFFQSAALDILGLSLFSTNIPFPPYGTVLCDTAFLLRFTAPGVPFNIQIPPDCTLVGVSLCVSGASIDLVGTLLYTNALDITIGTL